MFRTTSGGTPQNALPGLFHREIVKAVRFRSGQVDQTFDVLFHITLLSQSFCFRASKSKVRSVPPQFELIFPLIIFSSTFPW